MWIPKEGRLDFTQEVLFHGGRDFEGGSGTEQVSKKYTEEDFDIQFSETHRSLMVVRNTVPDEQAIRDLLDIRFMNAGGYEKLMDNGQVKLLLTDPISYFINSIQRMKKDEFSLDNEYRYKINDFQADKNTWGLELISICNSGIEYETLMDEEIGIPVAYTYPADQVDAFTQSLYGFTMDKGENYQDGKYVVPDDISFNEAVAWLS